MTVTLNVQSDDGTVVDANAYITLAQFKTYHDNRGNAYGANDELIKAAIVKATDYLDTRFRFRGIKLLTTQTTMWPRRMNSDVFISWQVVDFGQPSFVNGGLDTTRGLVDANGAEVVGVPLPIKNANAEYALRAMSNPLFQDAPAPEGGRVIDEETVTVDVITHQVKYAPSQGSGNFAMPAYPAVDLMLTRSGLVESGRLLYR